MTSRETIKRWLEEGKTKGATHVIVACDTFEYSDYPIFVMPGENAQERAKNLGSMQKLMECYSLSKDIESQLNEFRAYHFD